MTTSTWLRAGISYVHRKDYVAWGWILAARRDLQELLAETFPIESQDDEFFDLDQGLADELAAAEELVSDGSRSTFDQLSDELADLEPAENEAELTAGLAAAVRPDLELEDLGQPEAGADIQLSEQSPAQEAEIQLLRAELEERDQDEVAAEISMSVDRGSEVGALTLERLREQVESQLDESVAAGIARNVDHRPEISQLYPPPLTRAGSLREGMGIG